MAVVSDLKEVLPLYLHGESETILKPIYLGLDGAREGVDTVLLKRQVASVFYGGYDLLFSKYTDIDTRLKYIRCFLTKGTVDSLSSVVYLMGLGGKIGYDEDGGYVVAEDVPSYKTMRTGGALSSTIPIYRKTPLVLAEFRADYSEVGHPLTATFSPLPDPIA